MNGDADTFTFAFWFAGGHDEAEALLKRHHAPVCEEPDALPRFIRAAEEEAMRARRAEAARYRNLALTHPTWVDRVEAELINAADVDVPLAALKPSQRVVWATSRSCLAGFLQNLPGSNRAAFILIDILKMTPRAAAKLRNIKESAMHTRLSRARARLDEHMRPFCGFIAPGSLCSCEALTVARLAAGKEIDPGHDIPDVDFNPVPTEVEDVFRHVPTPQRRSR